jgi:hypothetical protein
LASALSSNAQGKSNVIGSPAVTSALPLYLALEKGYFTKMGPDVQIIAVTTPQEVVEGIIAGKIQATGNGVSAGNLAIGEDKSPVSFQILCPNSSNTKIKPALTSRVPLPGYRMFDKFSPNDVKYFQIFLNFLTREKVLRRQADVLPLLLST